MKKILNQSELARKLYDFMEENNPWELYLQDKSKEDLIIEIESDIMTYPKTIIDYLELFLDGYGNEVAEKASEIAKELSYFLI